MGRFTARTNQHGQTLVIETSNASLPHVLASFYDGGIYATVTCVVQPGETNEQAAFRRCGDKIASKWLNTLTVTPIVWRD